MEIIDGITWDVGPNDDVKFFDPELSYYITKYRPINKTKGLDFDPNWFTEDARKKEAEGSYSGMVAGSKSQRDFWRERFRRSIHGYESHGYRVTGDNYFFLNFYRMKISEEGDLSGQGRSMGFPQFFVYQYEYFHYVEMCEMLGFDVGLLKSRGIGFSEIGASLCVRPFITTPNYRIMASAFADRHLKPLLAKVWVQLDWLNAETETAFRRERMAVNTTLHKRASLKEKDGREFGHMAEIEGVVADHAWKIRGDRTERLFFEEAGSDKLFEKKWTQGEALVTTMGRKIGTRIGWGTGGDEGASIEGIRKMTTDPESFNILPFINRHTIDGKPIETAMFIPAYSALFPHRDKRGWIDPDKGRAFYEKERKKRENNPKGLMLYIAEFCFTIEEALSGEGDNIFPREQLAEQKVQLELYKKKVNIETGWLMQTLDAAGNPTGEVHWEKRPNGKIVILEHPIKSEDGLPYNNLYVGGIDSIDIGSKDTSTNDKKQLSDFCIVIKKRQFGLQEPKYVAMYKYRPDDPRTAYEIAAKMLMYYNAKAVLESTRTAILTHFRNKKYLYLLMKRPRSTMPNIAKGNPNMYGTPTPTGVIKHYIELIYEYVLDYCHQIDFIEMVDQLLNYSDEFKKKFDIIAAMGMAELGDEELSAKQPREKEAIAKQFKDIGYYKDSNGRKQFGVIPTTEDERYERTRIRTRDSWLHQEFI